MNQKDIVQQANADREQAFQEWMKTPAVKLLVSMVPATEPPETLTSLLQAAFDGGSSFGLGFALQTIVKGIIEKKGE